MTLEMNFVELRADFERWAHACVSAEQVQRGEYDEAGYPEWTSFEERFVQHVADGTIHALQQDELRDLLFLIARSWDLGRVLAWLSSGAQFSNVAPLSEHDTLFLAEASLGFEGAEFDAARQQLAVVLGRAQGARERALDVLTRLYERDDEYTKRMALLSLGTLDSPQILALVPRSWDIADEYQRIACLEVLARGGHDDALLEELLHRAADLPGAHLAAHRRKLLAKRDARRANPRKE